MPDDTIYYILFDIACLIFGLISTVRLKKRYGNDFVRFQPMFGKTKNSIILLVTIILLMNSIFIAITFMDTDFNWSEVILTGTSLTLINGLFAWNVAYMFIGRNGIAVPLNWKADRSEIINIISPNDIGQEIFTYKVVFNTNSQPSRIDVKRSKTEEFMKILKKYGLPTD